MQFGSFTVPLLSLVAAGAGVLVLLVVWGVWRARRIPAPAPLPVAPPDVPERYHPSAEDWTGEGAGGPADPPRPPRPRTVADVVAERRAGAFPAPVPPARPDPAVPAHGRPDAASDAPEPAPPVPVHPREPVGRHAAPDASDLPAPPEEGSLEALFAPADEVPDAATLDRMRQGTGGDRRGVARRDERPAPRDRAVTDDRPVTGDRPECDDRPVPGERPVHADRPASGGPSGPDDDPEAPGRAGPGAAPGPIGDPRTPLPPWSAERTEPAAQDLPAGQPDTPDAEPAAAHRPGHDTPAVPDPAVPDPAVPETMSRAVQQALAARAVQRARQLRGEIDPPPAAPASGDEPGQPLTVVPSPPATPASATGPTAAAARDARDRLLSVLLADPARALDATQLLDDSRDRISQLDDVLRRRRDELAGAVRHLHDCGLDPAQIGRLSGMDTADVRMIVDGQDSGR
ncbi:hypothetical protein WIS52_10720 [Pseudonocardia nematodicida]|uniref:Uncharacterized protein n=1 Tax=Pseudonocardia nematodicida TaxID=1206997 RepID=A0ABV1K8Z3_9PSEU